MLEGGEVECVTNFKYLGSVLEANGGENCQGSKSFWGL